MKKFLSIFAIMLLIVLMVTSTEFNTPTQDLSAKLKKQYCSGYTIFEAGKGIDCYGDTVALVKRHGYYELASLGR